MSEVAPGSHSRRRRRGYEPWNPRPGSKISRVWQHAEAVLHEYVGGDVVPALTTRTILYRLLPLGWSKADEGTLTKALVRARRAGMLDYRWLADGRSEEVGPNVWPGPDALRERWHEDVEHYRLDPLIGQPRIELWVESAGMLDMLAGLAEELGVWIYTSSGVDTLGAKMRAAARCLATDEGRVNVFVGVGDYDPDGEQRFIALREDVAAFVDGRAPVTFVTAALTEEQIAEHAIPTTPAPARRRGRRLPAGWSVGDPTAQAEALPPEVLLAAIRETVHRYLDPATLARTQAESERQRETLRRELPSA